MRSEHRIFRTTDGRLVADGHPDAAFLAYLPGDEVDQQDVVKLKLRVPPEDKMAARPADKAARPARRGRKVADDDGEAISGEAD